MAIIPPDGAMGRSLHGGGGSELGLQDKQDSEGWRMEKGHSKPRAGIA